MASHDGGRGEREVHGFVVIRTDQRGVDAAGKEAQHSIEEHKLKGTARPNLFPSSFQDACIRLFLCWFLQCALLSA